ncbi:MAG: hypothetical protein QOI53_2446 [Verrucomicrobiota bacterium]|nr:hypothetical protein [Verrucomicrobiota bacterium]
MLEILITANSQEWTDWETPGKIRPIAPRHVPQVSQRKKARRDALLATKSVSVILNGRQADDDEITFQAGFKSSNSIFLSGQFPEPPRTGIPYVLSRRAVSYDNSAYKTHFQYVVSSKVNDIVMRCHMWKVLKNKGTLENEG